MPEVSRYAIVEKSAKLARDVRIGAFSYIGPHVRLRRGCVIESNVTITGKTVLGEKNHVFPMAVIGAGLNGEQDGECVIGKANAIREHATIYAGVDRPTRIGTDNLIMIACEVGAGADVGDHNIFANCTYLGAGAEVADYVRTSGFAMVNPASAVGAYTFIAGHAIIEKYAPPFAIVQSCPFRVRGVNTENLRRCGFAEDDIRALRGAFRELFNGQNDHSRPPLSKELPKALAANSYVVQLLKFLKQHAESCGADDA